MFDDVLDGTKNKAPGTLMNIKLRGIQVDASVPIERVINFKERRKDQYLEFRSQIDELASTLQISNEESLEEIMAKATGIYERKVERGLRQFKREIGQNSITSIWEGAFTAATVSASSTTALAYFSGLSGPALLGAAASVSALNIGVNNYLAGRKLRVSSPYSYLHDVHASFGLPEFT